MAPGIVLTAILLVLPILAHVVSHLFYLDLVSSFPQPSLTNERGLRRVVTAQASNTTTVRQPKAEVVFPLVYLILNLTVILIPLIAQSVAGSDVAHLFSVPDQSDQTSLPEPDLCGYAYMYGCVP